MLGKNCRLFRMLTGEMVITEVDTNDEGNYLLSYPATIVPIPPGQAGGQQNQVGFGRFMPFSDYGEDMIMTPEAVACDSSPSKQMVATYEQWVTQVRSQDSGIIVPNMAQKNLPKSGQGQPVDFSKLNT